MDLIKRYTYAVTRELPEAQRPEIEKELTGLIEDMLAERTHGRQASQADVEAVLTELGEPLGLADKYRGHKRSLIGPWLFPKYLFTLRIVLLAVGLGMLVAFSIKLLQSPPDMVDIIIELFSSVIEALFQAFAWVTIIFAIIERVSVSKAEVEKIDKQWKPSDLPELPDSSLKLSKTDSVFNIFFTVLFLILATTAIHLFGIWFFDSSKITPVIPFFNVEVFRSYLPFIWVVQLLDIGKEIYALLSSRWSLPLIAASILVGLSGLILAVAMYTNPAIWNASFLQQVVQSGFAVEGSESYQAISGVWHWVTHYIVYAIVLGFIIHMASLAVKGYRMLRAQKS